MGQNLYVEPDGRAYPCYAWHGEQWLLGAIDIDTKTIHDLAQELAENRYQPKPVRRVYIPKGKMRSRL